MNIFNRFQPATLTILRTAEKVVNVEQLPTLAGHQHALWVSDAPETLDPLKENVVPLVLEVGVERFRRLDAPLPADTWALQTQGAVTHTRMSAGSVEFTRGAPYVSERPAFPASPGTDAAGCRVVDLDATTTHLSGAPVGSEDLVDDVLRRDDALRGRQILAGAEGEGPPPLRAILIPIQERRIIGTPIGLVWDALPLVSRFDDGVAPAARMLDGHPRAGTPGNGLTAVLEETVDGLAVPVNAEGDIPRGGSSPE